MHLAQLVSGSEHFGALEAELKMVMKTMMVMQQMNEVAFHVVLAEELQHENQKQAQLMNFKTRTNALVGFSIPNASLAWPIIVAFMMHGFAGSARGYFLRRVYVPYNPPLRPRRWFHDCIFANLPRGRAAQKPCKGCTCKLQVQWQPRCTARGGWQTS